MRTHERLQKNAAADVHFPAVCMEQTKQEDALAWFAISGEGEEITSEKIADIEAFLDFAQKQQKAR